MSRRIDWQLGLTSKPFRTRMAAVEVDVRVVAAHNQGDGTGKA